MGRAAPIWNMRPQIRKGERASAIVEAVICMLLLLLVTFGLLQIFYYSAAQMITDYAAFRAARSAMVGFNESQFKREAKLKAIPASGHMRKPIDTLKVGANDFFSTPISQFYYEKIVIRDYLSEDYPKISYQYWNKNEDPDNDEQKDPSKGYETFFETEVSEQGDAFTAKSTFYDYPWAIPFREAFLPRTGGKINIQSEVKMSRHSTVYLE